MEKDELQSDRSCSKCATDIFEEKEPLWKQRQIVIILASGILLCVGALSDFLAQQHLFAQILFVGVVVIAGYNIIKKGIRSLLKNASI